MNEKTRFYARFYEKCPYCERSFKKTKYLIQSKQIKEWLELFLNRA